MDVRLRDIIDFHRRHAATATMVVRPDPNAARHDAIMLDASAAGCMRSSGIMTTADRGAADRQNRMMYAGIMAFEPRVFDYMPQGVFSITHDVFPRLLADGEPLYGYVHEGYWARVGYAADLAAGREELAQRGAR